MAIFHQQHKHISRGEGRSATAAAAYRGGLDITDERTGEKFTYARRGGVLDHAVLVPDNAPEWAHDPAALWNEAEKAERYKNARTAIEDIIALPHELDLEQNRAWLHGFVHEAYVSKGQAVQVDIHAPDQKGDHRNFHAHVLATTRILGAEGFEEKAELEWSNRRRAQHGLRPTSAELTDLRALCAEHCNRGLERGGIEESVDSRSLKDQGIDREPTKHMGPAATAIHRKGQDTRIAQENENIECWNRDLADMQWQESIIAAAIEKEQQRMAEEKEAQVKTSRMKQAARQDRYPDREAVRQQRQAETEERLRTARHRNKKRQARSAQPAPGEQQQAKVQEAKEKARQGQKNRIEEAMHRKLVSDAAKIKNMGSFAEELDKQRAADEVREAEEARNEYLYRNVAHNIEEAKKHRASEAGQKTLSWRERLRRAYDETDRQQGQQRGPPAPAPAHEKTAADMMDKFERATNANDNAPKPKQDREQDREQDEGFDMGR